MIDAPHWLVDAIVVAYFVMVVAGLAFTAMYVRTAWRHHPWGRHVMAFMVVFDLSILEALTRWWFGNYPGYWYVILVESWAFAAVMAQRAWVQWRMTRQEEKRP